MPTIRYFNESIPFWDFIASLEEHIAALPVLGDASKESDDTNPSDAKPCGDVKKGEGRNEETPCGHTKRAPGNCGGRGRFHHRGHGAFHNGFGGPHGFGGPLESRPRGFPFHLSPFAGHPWVSGSFRAASESETNQDFSPPVDVFEMDESYVIHISLPGAQKDDVGINWNGDKSELSIAGVIYRPGDEEFLKTLALSERAVGPFDRKVRLGNESYPVRVAEDAITAKLEDGVLVVVIPKQDKGFVEVKKVDIE